MEKLLKLENEVSRLMRNLYPYEFPGFDPRTRSCKMVTGNAGCWVHRNAVLPATGVSAALL